MAETVQNRVFQEGNYGFKVFPLNSDGTYGTGATIDGLVNVDITFSSTKTNIPADYTIDYLHRESPLKGEGTITFVGIKNADYAKLFANCVDTNNAVIGGRKNQSKKVGVIFFNTTNFKDGSGVEHSVENMISLPNCIFSLPNIQTQTIQEDDTTIRNIELPVNCNPQNFTNEYGDKDRYTWASISKTEATDLGYTWADVTATVYKPNAVFTASQL